ncbi:MAG: hypothetical protein GY870_10595 [archaeon]|nr:hypothetical protein [archaeon]
MNSESFKDHTLYFLGTGGGRFHTVTQYRKTGGFIYAFNGKQVHIDPGPGAIVYLNQMKIDRLKTKWIVVTHFHTDHSNDVPVIIESMHKKLHKPIGTLISTQEFIDELSIYYKGLLEKIIAFKPGKKEKITEFTEIIGVPTFHGDIQGFGIIFKQIDPNNSNNAYSIGYTSDTEIFPEYSQKYKDIDILIANVLRPDDKHCPRHTTVDELIPEIEKIRPKTVIMTHFGAFMDSKWSKNNLVPQQVKKMHKVLGEDISIIGAEDGMRIKIRDILKK